VNKIVKTFSRVLPGSISEMMPDYGCFTQAWTNYGIVLPIISHIFGIDPDAALKKIEIAPNIPDKWKKDNLSITALRVGDNEISISYEGGRKYTIVSKKPGWQIEFKPKPEGSCRYVANGKLIPADSRVILLTRRINTIVIVPGK